MGFRVEKDLLGEKHVPGDAYYGIHTVRSKEVFQISGLKTHRGLISALAQIKIACARANNYFGLLDSRRAEAIEKACLEILEGRFWDQFPLDIFGSGSGTSMHMNLNEVVANRANELLGKKKGEKFVHPIDHVNLGQSTNDVYTTAIRIASMVLAKKLGEELARFVEVCKLKSEEFRDVIKSGRTHLRDAVPITLGQEFSSYAAAFAKHQRRLGECLCYLAKLGIGGNAVGTGLGTPRGFREKVVSELRTLTKLDLKVADNPVEAVWSLTDLAHLSSCLKLIAVDLNKMANDLRLLSSGPNTGLAEINLPVVELGSSMMPGKVNPTICEAVNMVCTQIFGSDTTITIACQAGQLELNTHMPIVGYNILQSLEILRNGLRIFGERCVSGITPNRDLCKKYFERSLGLVTALSPHIGYEKAAEIAEEALRTKKTLREIILAKKILSDRQVEELFNPEKLVGLKKEKTEKG